MSGIVRKQKVDPKKFGRPQTKQIAKRDAANEKRCRSLCKHRPRKKFRATFNSMIELLEWNAQNLLDIERALKDQMESLDADYDSLDKFKELLTLLYDVMEKKERAVIAFQQMFEWIDRYAVSPMFKQEMLKFIAGLNLDEARRIKERALSVGYRLLGEGSNRVEGEQEDGPQSGERGTAATSTAEATFRRLIESMESDGGNVSSVEEAIEKFIGSLNQDALPRLKELSNILQRGIRKRGGGELPGSSPDSGRSP